MYVLQTVLKQEIYDFIFVAAEGNLDAPIPRVNFCLI
jgi:hypothetical protein